MIRQARLADIPAIVELAIEALSIDPYEGMKISRLRVYEATKSCVLDARNYTWVAEHEGSIQAVLGADVLPNMFHEKSQALIYMWFSKCPGAGVKLMRHFLAWCAQRPQIKQIVYTGERNADPRVGELAKRLGLTEILPLYIKMNTAEVVPGG